MALILQKILNFHDQALEQWKDPRLDDWFLMNSIWPTLTIVSCYLYFVLSLGPKLMENRQPFKLDKILIVYNAIQVLYCAAIFIVGHIYILPYYNIFCEPCDYSNSFRGILAAKLGWWYFVLKLLDLLDTIFFVLRKNYHQISFLHTYHHAMVVVAVWIGLKFIPGGSVFYLAYMNAAVHMVMYSYYLLSVVDKSYRNNLWVKKQITHFQIIQFVINIVMHTIILINNECSLPKWPSLIIVPQNMFMLYMFGDFYLRSYILPNKKHNGGRK